MLERVMQAPINLYYDITPIGRIQTRFTKDLGAVEGQFYYILQEFLTLGSKILNVVLLAVYTAPKIIIVIGLMMVQLIRIGFN